MGAYCSRLSKAQQKFSVIDVCLYFKSNHPFDGPTEAGIFSFKNFKAGVIRFTKKNKPGNGASKQQQISEEILESYETQLLILLKELFNPNIEFIEKEV